jgi:hypothetical protein
MVDGSHPPPTLSRGPSIDCLYLSGKSMAKDLSNKIAVCPSAWWRHLFKLCGYTERTAKSLMDCFDANSSTVAHMLTFDQSTVTVTIQFANTDNFLDRVENELGSNDDTVSLDKSEGEHHDLYQPLKYLRQQKHPLPWL